MNLSYNVKEISQNYKPNINKCFKVYLKNVLKEKKKLVYETWVNISLKF